MTREEIENKVIKTIQEASKQAEFDIYNPLDLVLAELRIRLQNSISNDRPKKSLLFIIKNLFFKTLKITKSLTSKRLISSDRVDVIFWITEYSHINQLIPIYNKLREQNTSCQIFTNKQKVGLRLKSIRLHHVYIPNYSINLKLFFDFKRKLKNKVSKFVREGVSDLLFDVCSLINLNHDIERNLSPKVLIVGNDLTIEGRIATAVFKNKGIKTLSIQHGDMSGEMHRFHIVDTFYLYGFKSFKIVQSLVSDVENFKISGAPYLSNLRNVHEHKSSDRLQILVAFSGPGNNTSYTHHKKLIDIIDYLGVQRQELDIVIKLHPKDKESYYSKITENSNLSNLSVIAHTADSNIFSFLSTTDILITGASTTAIEAMFLGIPVISIDLMDEYLNFEFLKNGCVARVKRYEDLLLAIDMLKVNTPQREVQISKGREFASEYFYSRDQAPEEIIYDDIKNELNRS